MTAEAVQVPGYVAGKWNVDTVHSHVGFTVRHMMEIGRASCRERV